MSGSSRAVPRLGAVKEEVLETMLRFVPSRVKLRPPELRPGIAPRPNLLAQLDEADTTSTVLVAPPGYGKTTIVTQWVNDDERPFAWLTVSDSDNDPAQFLAYVALMVDSLEPLDPRTFAALALSGADLTSVRLPRLGNVLGTRSRSFVLVLDDVHVLHEPGAVASLQALAGYMPAGSRLVLSGRSDPLVSLPRMRTNGSVLRIGAEGLTMTEWEAGEMVSRAGVEVNKGTLESLVERTEGWPAGLYLAAMALRESPDIAAAAERFAGHDRLVTEYLRNEALQALPDRLRDFLIRSSVLDRLSSQVCDAVLRRHDSGHILQELEASNLFLIPLDRHGGWYRYHHLFQDMLQGELHRLHPELEATLHLRASTWWEEHGDVHTAIAHARAAGDFDRTAALVWCNAPTYLSRGRTTTVTRWLEAFPEDEVAARPTLALTAAFSSLTVGDTGSIGYWTSLAERGGDDELPGGTSLSAVVGLLRALAGGEGLRRAREDAALAFELDRPDSPFRCSARAIEGSVLRMLGELQLARERLEEAAKLAWILHPAQHAHCLAQLALIAIEEGNLSEAAYRVDGAMRLVEMYSLGERPLIAVVYAAAALSYARRGETGEAREAFKHGLWLLEKLVGIGPSMIADTALTLARAGLVLGEVATARMLVRETGRLLAKQPDTGVLPDMLRDIEKMTDASAVPVGLTATPLTPAEMRVLRYLPTHLSFKAIADELIVSRNTVKTHAIAVYRKLGVTSRARAVARARDLGVLERGG